MNLSTSLAALAIIASLPATANAQTSDAVAVNVYFVRNEYVATAGRAALPRAAFTRPKSANCWKLAAV